MPPPSPVKQLNIGEKQLHVQQASETRVSPSPQVMQQQQQQQQGRLVNNISNSLNSSSINNKKKKNNSEMSFMMSSTAPAPASASASTSTSTSTNDLRDRKDYFSSASATTIDLSPHPRFAHDYPVFTPLLKANYEQVGRVENTPPPDSSGSNSGDSLEALRDEEDWLSPLVLDDAALPHALDFQFPLHPPATSASNARLAATHQAPPGTASATLHNRPKVEPRPYHITSIHPNRGPPMLAHKRKPRIRSAEFSRHTTYPEWSATSTTRPPPFTHRKVLSELVSAKLKYNPTHPSAYTLHSQLPDNSDGITNIADEHSFHDPPSASIAASSDNGCMQSCDKCLPGSRMTVVPITDSCDYTEISPKESDFANSSPVTAALTSKSKGTNNPFISWFRSKKKQGPGQASVGLKGSKSQGDIKGTSNHVLTDTEKERVNIREKLMNLEEGKDTLEMAVNTMKQEVSEANEKRDAALVEVFELRMAMEEMGKKVESLESYCQSLQTATTKNKNPTLNAYNNMSGQTGSYDELMHIEMIEDEHDQMLHTALASPLQSAISNSFVGPTKKEFYHAITEARVGVKQFCRTLLQQVQGQAATEKIESILQPYNVKVAPRVSKVVRYHLESLINAAFYEDFENIKFQKNGTNCVLDPQQRSQAFYKTYLGMSQMGWSELVSKESAVYSQSFDSFCDHKMNRVELVLNWEGRWPDDLARSFFVAAKWVWLLHLLAFSFHHPAHVFRVGCEAHFDSRFMEELPLDQQSSKVHAKLSSTLEAASSIHIKAMVMPGFFFNNYQVIKCKIILSRQPVITTN